MLADMCVSVSMLASGSRGNCAIVASTQTRILVDAGISCRETFKRMKLLGEDPQSLNAILITHEHSDHIYGLATLAKKLRIPVFMTGPTHAAWARMPLVHFMYPTAFFLRVPFRSTKTHPPEAQLHLW